jgi:hypothetical protein
MRHMHQRWPGLCWASLATLVYTLVAILITYPLILNLSSSIVGSGDCYEYVWVLWRVKQVVLGSGGGLAYLPWLNHPVGMYHPFMLTMLTVDLTALPLLLIFPPHIVYNLLILSGFVFCGLSAYWFTSELTRNRKAGLVAGFVFGFFLNKMGHVIGGHLPQTMAYWVPLFALFLWRVVWMPTWRGGLICGLVLVPTLLVHPMHVAYFVLPVTLATLLYALIELRRGLLEQRRLWILLLVFGIAAFVVVPIWWPSILAEMDEGYLGSAGGTVKYSTDLLAFFTPSPYHPVLGPAGLLPGYLDEVFPSRTTLYEGLAYPGLLVVLLGIWALVKHWRQAWIWGLLAMVCMVLALGPILKVGGEAVVYTVDEYQTNIVLPYALIKSLPLFSASRTPGRFNETASFALAVLAAFGFDALSQQLKGRWVSFTLVGILAIGIVFEMLAMLPLPSSETTIPRVLHAIAAEDGTGALLHAPPLEKGKTKRAALYYQTVHERPIGGGYVHRSLPEAKPWEATLNGLIRADQAEGDIVPRPDLAQRRDWLRYFDIDYIILNKDETGDDYRPFIEELIGAAVDEDDEVAAFAVPDSVVSNINQSLYTIGEGWTPPFQNKDETWERWALGSGQIYVYAPEAQQVRIQFTVESALDLADLALEVDGVLVDRFVVGERSTYVSRLLTWEQGMHTVLFTRVQGCEGLSYADECKVFALGNVTAIPESELPGEITLDVNLADLIHLTGYALDTSALRQGGTLTVTLNWHTVKPPPENFVVFAHLLNKDGVLVAQRDAEPADGRFPTSAWPTGSTFGYSVSMQLPADLPSGDYRLLVGMYRWPSLERLPVLSNVPGAENHVIELETVTVFPVQE